MPQAQAAETTTALRASSTGHGSSDPPGWTWFQVMPATMPSAATGTISVHRRRVASETVASSAGPAGRLNAIDISVVTTATATGQRRRQQTSTNAGTAIASSAVRIVSGCCSTTTAQSRRPTVRARTMRQVCPHPLSGGGVGAGSSTRPG